MKVFWSWQSDTHQPSGRHFVQEILQRVCKELTENPEVDLPERPEIDHDTLDVAGSPPIAATILRKIDEAAVFVADVTPVAIAKIGKHVANPNVMIELGYALAKLDHERLILVMNIAEGATLRHLPFDLKHWRAPISYSLSREAADEIRSAVGDELAMNLRQRLTPSLKAAERIEGEKRRQKIRAPELAVAFRENRQSFINLKISQKVNIDGAQRMNKIRDEILSLEMLSTHPDNHKKKVPGLFSGLYMSTPQLLEFNKALLKSLKQYEDDYKKYLIALEKWHLEQQRCISIELKVINSGTAPANNVDATFEFPYRGIMLEDGKPLPPEEPKKPTPLSLANRQSFAPPLVPMKPRWPMPAVGPMTTLDVETKTIHFRVDNIKHGTELEVRPFWVKFQSSEEIGSFAAKYTITANEPIDPIRGELQFHVELDGG